MWFCPGNAGVCGNEQAYTLAGEATAESTLTLDPPTVLSLVSEHMNLTYANHCHKEAVPLGKGRVGL